MYDKAGVYRYRKGNPNWRKDYLARHPEQREKQLQAVTAFGIRRAEERKAFMQELKNRPCMDCGGWFNPWQMDFDHRDPKTKVKTVGLIKNYKAILEEISKCDLVCANCHRDRTQKRFKRGYSYV